jgi:nicotinate phosphoribosyltransferase
VLGIALTDTFGTPAFLKAFAKPIPQVTVPGSIPSILSAASTTTPSTTSLVGTNPSSDAPINTEDVKQSQSKTYAEVFAGIRQDSGDPSDYVKTLRQFYDAQGITDKKTMVFSDSLNVDLCLEYKKVAEDQGFQPTFGVGTYFTSKTDFYLPSIGD